jgi:hypothetical protein
VICVTDFRTDRWCEWRLQAAKSAPSDRPPIIWDVNWFTFQGGGSLHGARAGITGHWILPPRRIDVIDRAAVLTVGHGDPSQMGYCKPMGCFPMRDVDQLIAELEIVFGTKSSLYELRAGARAPIEELETEAFRAWGFADDEQRNEILRSIDSVVRALQARSFHRLSPLGVTEAKLVQDGLVLRLRALLHHLDPQRELPPDDF